MSTPVIRSVLPGDEPAWRRLWRGYCEFYAVHLPDEVTQRTWKRILDPDSGVMCVLAEVEGRVAGFAHCVVHENTWEIQPVCYLEDLFVDPDRRGAGVGKALLEWLRNAMRAEGWARLYWVTHKDNADARALYDQFAKADDFVRYVVRDKSRQA
ncbi:MULTISPECIES: GNAT family N-acetyltransferase [Ramlibacter]|uniref:GNAT family N-acetyltransferase n=1 Tax=Ramlibacter pinisoli TaxID=2682844 RepID=A0A6N8IXT9_9BURK|nr:MULTISPECIES: GNAT family N-acetyltransferase [Ramlibacter]MBA2961509.1 GNAT family N-acetyltransferase [Ramlibacter sp. CGMCC 1.13660]MVQ31452.1 GNAT family N-acetyltransferase [Ramlibacter pinisoli]